MADTFSVVNSTAAMASELEAIQRASFPTLAEEEIITAAHYEAHVRRFPEGQSAVVAGDGRVVACSTDFRTTFRLDHIEHRYIGGLLRGYGQVKARMSVDDYVAQVIAGTLFDPTLSVQLRYGFQVHGIIRTYVHDPACDNKAALIVWHNPEYQ
ncbi:MAG TPA: hypothetical protein VLD61_04170, partial [Methylomirabilota bacterium]|nr:hypothetical protein [Methylomirabilota bacterium]